MSSKTTFKRVALVAVAALGLGVLTTAPSQAAINADSFVLSSATAAQTSAETATATSATATLSFLGTAGDSASVTAALVSGPAGTTALPYLQLAETSSAVVGGTNAIGTVTSPNTAIKVKAGSSTAVTSAKFKVYLGKGDSLTAPTVVGTYVVKLTPATVDGSGALLAATAQTLTITVTAAPALDTTAKSATIIINKGETNVATVDDVVTSSKTIPAAGNTTAAATLSVDLLNAAGLNAIESFTATVTGAGLLGSGAQGAQDAHNITATGRTIVVKDTDVVRVFPDGTSGVATVTVSSAAGVVLGTKTLTFYGDAASVTAKTTALTTGTVAKVGANAGLISFTVKDSAGTDVSTGSYYLVSADATKISNSYTACNAWDATDGFTCDVTGVAKGTTTVYVTNKPSATDTTVTTVIKSADVSVRVGSSTPASVSVALDKASYAPGEKATLTVTLKDADGNVLPSDTYTAIFADGGIVASYTLGTGSATITGTGVVGAIDGAKAYTLYMPVTEGPVTFTYTTGSVTGAANTGLAVANQAKKVVLSANVGSGALEAANAATTAALAANDAVDALAATVAKLVANLKAQITALTKLIVKIQKKVGA